MADEPTLTGADAVEDPDVIRQQMQESRTALSEKLEALEQKVSSTVAQATSAVTDTVTSVKENVQEAVGAVKETVQDTVDSVKSSLDVTSHVQNYPWPVFGGSVLVGYLLGSLLHGRRPHHAYGASWDDHGSHSHGWLHNVGSSVGSAVGSAANTVAGYVAGGHGSDSVSAGMSEASDGGVPTRGSTATYSSSSGSWLGSLADSFGPEIQRVKALALGTLVGVARDFILQSVPENVKHQVGEVVDNISSKLGAEQVQPGGSQAGAHAGFRG